MANSKKWIKTEELKYSFEVDGKSIGTLELIYKNFDRKAIFVIGDQKFILEYNGFWKSNFEIKEENEVVIMKTFTEKWYANSTILEYKGKKLRLKVRNNPLAEYVIFDGDQEILAYGLDTESKEVAVRITTNTSDYLLDYLLWYTFLPIAQENIGADTVFPIILINQ